MESSLTALGRASAVEGWSKKEKREKVPMDKNNSVVIAGGGEGWVEVKEGMGRINGNGKNFKNNSKC